MMNTSIAVFEVSLDLFCKRRDCSLDGIFSSFHILIDFSPEVVAFLLGGFIAFSKSIHV